MADRQVDRRSASRRADDKDRDMKIAQAQATSARALQLIEEHLPECTGRYNHLNDRVEEAITQIQPMAAWHAARLKRAEFWARLADKATDKIMDRVVLAAVVLAASAAGIKLSPMLLKLLAP